MDQILIEKLSAHTIIGIHDWERKRKQPIVVDLCLDCSTQAAAQSDEIQHALDYQQLCNQLTAYIENSNFQLIETLAESCAQFILENFTVARVDLKLCKPEAIENTHTVGVRIIRSTTD